MANVYDGPDGDSFVSPARLTKTPRKQFPFRVDLTAVLYFEDYAQRAEYFQPAALDLTHPDFPTAFLVNETNPAPGSDGLVRFSRTFATVPAERTEFQKGGFSFPAYKTLSADTAYLRDGFTQTVVAKNVYTYLRTTDPGADLTITGVFQPLDADVEKVDFVANDSTPTRATYEGYVTAGTYIQSAETEISRWMGNIWQMRNVLVKAL
jgi:hypothetical protein